MKIRKNFIKTGVLFLLFLFFTVLVMKVDVQTIGPEQSKVGLATINQIVHERFRFNIVLYNITNFLGTISILVAVGFGILGMVQLLCRKSLLKVDLDIIALGVCYGVVMASYLFFEICIINYRPIIMDKGLEASFPSSHVMIVVCIMATAMIQFSKRIKVNGLKIVAQLLSVSIIVIMIVGRLISGVHWFTDIVAGLMLGSFIVMLYYSIYKLIESKKNNML